MADQEAELPSSQEVEERMDSDSGCEEKSSAVTTTATEGSRSSIKVKKTVLKKNEAGQPKKGGRPSKVRAGYKFCTNGCFKEHPIHEFPDKSARCYAAKQAFENLRNAASAQGHESWWTEVVNNPKQLKMMIARYKLRFPKLAGKRRETVHVMELWEEHRHEQALIKDAVVEMMNVRYYVHFMATPRNGCIDPITPRQPIFGCSIAVTPRSQTTMAQRKNCASELRSKQRIL